MRWEGHVARIVEKKIVYKILVGRPEGKSPFGRTRRGWEEKIKSDIGTVGWGWIEWIGLAQDSDRWRAVINAVMIFRVV